MKTVDCAILFGGTGFIGTHLAQHLLREGLTSRLILVDLKPPSNEAYAAVLRRGLRDGCAEFVQWDVRRPLPQGLLPDHAELIFNLAAVHREPGHAPVEYFETNIRGAENVCAYAEASGCRRMVFTSSISPYGPSETPKDETTLPVPETPYGSSKLVAEKIHARWCSASQDRRLIIFRPGVVFGPGEGGNVTRLLRSLVCGYFVYLGNRKTRKAGGYVKELCHAAQFALEHHERSEERVMLLNFGMDPPCTVQDFVDAIRRVAEIRRTPPAFPRMLLLGLSYPIDAVARLIGIRQPVSPVRVRKLFRSTYVVPRRLREMGYVWKFTLDAALADWRRDSPDDFDRRRRPAGERVGHALPVDSRL